MHRSSLENASATEAASKAEVPNHRICLLISLNEAIMHGKINALDDKVEYQDFEH